MTLPKLTKDKTYSPDQVVSTDDCSHEMKMDYCTENLDLEGRRKVKLEILKRSFG